MRRAVAGALDITDRKRTEDILKAADRRKDEFLATLAHELCNPLAPLKNSLEVMKRAGQPALIEQAQATMERQIGQMVRLIDDLLDASRITLDKMRLKPERVELTTIVRHAVESTRPGYEFAGHQLILDLPRQTVYLDPDPVRLAQVFGNLLANSCKYTPIGGRIWLSAESREDEVVVRVRDTGIGIAPDMLGSVFDMFTQASPALSDAEGGLGIGLALVKRLVELHGGSVVAASDGQGLGSEFTVRLPVIDDLGAATTPTEDPLVFPVGTTSHRILVVDDNRDSAESLATLLGFVGHVTQTAYDGREAVSAAARFQPDVVLLDIGLPGLNGYEACGAIRDLLGPAVFILAISGWDQADDRRRSQAAGFNVHLVKPVEFANMLDLLASFRLPSDNGAAAG